LSLGVGLKKWVFWSVFGDLKMTIHLGNAGRFHTLRLE